MGNLLGNAGLLRDAMNRDSVFQDERKYRADDQANRSALMKEQIAGAGLQNTNTRTAMAEQDRQLGVQKMARDAWAANHSYGQQADMYDKAGETALAEQARAMGRVTSQQNYADMLTGLSRLTPSDDPVNEPVDTSTIVAQFNKTVPPDQQLSRIHLAKGPNGEVMYQPIGTDGKPKTPPNSLRSQMIGASLLKPDEYRDASGVIYNTRTGEPKAGNPNDPKNWHKLKVGDNEYMWNSTTHETSKNGQPLGVGREDAAAIETAIAKQLGADSLNGLRPESQELALTAKLQAMDWHAQGLVNKNGAALPAAQVGLLSLQHQAALATRDPAKIKAFEDDFRSKYRFDASQSRGGGTASTGTVIPGGGTWSNDVPYGAPKGARRYTYKGDAGEENSSVFVKQGDQWMRWTPGEPKMTRSDLGMEEGAREPAAAPASPPGAASTPVTSPGSSATPVAPATPAKPNYAAATDAEVQAAYRKAKRGQLDGGPPVPPELTAEVDKRYQRSSAREAMVMEAQKIKDAQARAFYIKSHPDFKKLFTPAELDRITKGERPMADGGLVRGYANGGLVR